MFQDTLIYHYFYRQTNHNNHLRKRFYFLGIAIITSTLFIFQTTNSSQLGLKVFSGVSWIFFMVSSIFIPIWATKEIHDEKNSKAFNLLFLANVPIFSIIFHKYICFVLTVSLNIIGTLPIFLFCVVVGGIAPHQVFYVYTILFVFIFFITSASFFIAVISPVHFSLAGSVLFVFALVFGLSFMDTHFGICISFSSFLQNSILDIPLGISVVVAYAIIALVLIFCAAIFAPYFMFTVNVEKTNPKKVSEKRKTIYNKNCYQKYEKKKVVYRGFRLISNILSVLIFCIISYCFFIVEKDFEEVIPLFVCFFIVVLCLVVISASLSFCFETREIELLFLTQITPREIVNVKQKNVFYSLLSLLTCLFGLFVLYGFLFYNWIAVSFLFTIIIFYCCLLLFFSMHVAIYFSAYYKKFTFSLFRATIHIVVSGIIFTPLYFIIAFSMPILGLVAIVIMACSFFERNTLKTEYIVKEQPQNFSQSQTNKFNILAKYLKNI